jgi:hypothetical protein
MEDIKNKNIYREYMKINDIFIGVDKFFISEEVDQNKFEYIQLYSNFSLDRNLKNKERIILVDDKYLSIGKNESNYLDLIIISNISFSLEEKDINKMDIIKKYINSNTQSNDSYEKLIEDIYYNSNFSKKINLNLPIKYNEHKDFQKKYLFKIDLYRDSSIENICIEKNI